MREKIKETFEDFATGYIEYIANQATVLKLSQDGNTNEEIKITGIFTKAMLLGISSILGSLKSTEVKSFGILLRDRDLKPLVQFSVRYREPINEEDKGSFALGIKFRPETEDLAEDVMEFTDPLVLTKISDTMLDRDKIEFYPQYINRVCVYLFEYIEKFLNMKYDENPDKDFEIEIPGYIIIALTYSELSEKVLINFTPYEEMKRLIKSDTMLEVAKRS